MRQAAFPPGNKSANKGGKRWLGQWVIIGRFGGKFAIVHPMGSYLEVNLDDIRPEDRLLDVIGRDGDLQLHLPSTKFLMQYLVESQAIILFSKLETRFRTVIKRCGLIMTPGLARRHFTNRPITRKSQSARWGY